MEVDPVMADPLNADALNADAASADVAAAFREPMGPGTAAALRSYRRLFQGQGARLLGAGAVYLVKHSPAVLLPVITGYTVDLLAAQAEPRRIALCALATALLIAQNLPGHRLYVRLISQAVRRVEAGLRAALAARLQLLALPWWWRQSPAALQTKLLRDVESVGQLTLALADGVLGCGSGIVVALAVTAWRAPQFLGLFLVTVPLASALVWLTRAHGLEPAQLERMGARIDGAARTGLALDLAGGRFGALAWVGFQGLNALCLFAAAAVHAGGWMTLTLGDVVLLSGFFATLTHSVLGLAGLVPQVHRGLEALRSIDELMRGAPVEPPGHLPPAEGPGVLQFDAVSLRHDGGAGVEALTLTLLPGRSTALVGPSGSGKSTLAMLACGLLRPQQGTVRLDGVPLQALDPQAWRRRIGWVPQDPLLGDGSLRESLLFGLPAQSEERLAEVLRESGCAEFVARLPQGLDTVLGHHGHRLSGGERQRLALARALLREPRLLVLDEPTSALDGENERTVLQALARVRGRCSTLVIAHRLSTVVDADCLVVMDAGRIVDRGRHDELLARCALYRRLWQPEEEDRNDEASPHLALDGPGLVDGQQPVQRH